MSQIPIIERACRTCSRSLPLEWFTENDTICNECMKAVVVQNKHKEMRKKARKALTDIIKQARPDTIKAPHISEVCAGVIEEIGGVDVFCKTLADDYREARISKPGSHTVVRFGENILRLIKDSSLLRDSAPDAQSMTDEELAGELLALFTNIAKNEGITLDSETEMMELIGDMVNGQQADNEASGGVRKQIEGSPADLQTDS